MLRSRTGGTGNEACVRLRLPGTLLKPWGRVSTFQLQTSAHDIIDLRKALQREGLSYDKGDTINIPQTGHAKETDRAHTTAAAPHCPSV